MENEIKGLITDFGNKVEANLTETKSAIDALTKRVDEVETKAARPAVAKAVGSEMDEVKSAFAAYIANPEDLAKKMAYETKAVTVAGLSNAVPRVVSNDIIAAARKTSTFANLVLMKNGISPEYQQIVSNGATYELVGESTARGSQDANFASKKPVFTELSSVITLSKQAIEDFGFNVVDEVIAMIGADFGVGMEQYLVTGTGTGVQNAGILLGGTELKTAAVGKVTTDDVLKLIGQVKVADAAQGAFVVSPETYAILSDEKISGQRIIDVKDSVDVIRGKPVYQSEFLTDATNPALFGNFKKGFLAGYHVAGVEITINPYKNVGFVDIQARVRFGSCVLHTGAYSKLKIKD